MIRYINGVPQEASAEWEAAFIAQQQIDSAPKEPYPFDIDVERDRRIANEFTFGGVLYQCDAHSQQNIIAKGAQAKFAILAGAEVNDLRWSNPYADFGWIATDNSFVPMDAQTMSNFADSADLWVTMHIVAARALKDASPIPFDYTDNKYWPGA